MSISILNIVKTTLIDIFTNSGSGSDEWKVLLLDDHGMNLVAPLFKVHDLRTQNITVHFHLRQKRDCIPDNVAIYVILPTEENINIILKDIEIDQYKLFYLYFVGRCPLSLLETFSKRVSCIQFDENRIHVSETLLNFLPQSDFFFTSRLAPSLHALHGSNRLVKNSLTEALAESLYHVIQNLNVHPIIVTPTTGICRSVFENLKDRCMHMDRIRDSKQPTLLLLDRMSDLATSLSFPFSYGGLIGDLMDFNLNKLRLTTSHEEKTFELSNGDEFWSQNASEDFSIVCTKVNDLITNFQREKESFQSLTGSNEFCSVLDRVSDLSTRKKIADIHAVVCHELLSIIRSRELDTYHAVSRELSTEANQSITQLLVDCVTKPTMGSDSDRLRILLQAIFSMPNFKSDLKNMTTILSNLTQRDPLLINSVVEWAITLSTSHIAKDLSKSADWFGQKLMSISRTINSSHEETYYSPFVRIVEMLSEMNPSSSKSENRQQFLQNVIAWDTRKNALCNIGSVDYCIIYVVGGITFSEIFELKAWCELPRNERKTILVGSTDVQNGATFLSQIMALSTEKS